MIIKKNANKITNVSRKWSETELPKERYISKDKRQKLIDDLRSIG